MSFKCSRCGYNIGEYPECPKCKFEEIYGKIDLRVKKDKELFEKWLKGEIK